MTNSKLSVIFDWLEFTILNTKLPQVLDMIGLEWDDFKPLSKGRFGITQIKWNDGSNFYHVHQH